MLGVFGKIIFKKMKNLEEYPWWSYLNKIQQDLIKQSFHLIEEEEKESEAHKDYSFVVFPAAKAYEGFLKKLFYDLGLISQDQFLGDKFRIGRALNPAVFKEYPHESVYEKLSRFCGKEEVPATLWRTWRTSRNLVFHFFEEKENLISLKEAKKRVEEIVEAIDFSFKTCQVSKNTTSYKEKMLKNCLVLYFFVFLFWSAYRFWFRLPTGFEETIIKPIIWLLPTIIFIKFFEKRPIFSSLGFGGKNFQNSLLLFFGFLVFFALEGIILGLSRYQSLFWENFFSLPISSLQNLLVILATAMVEETFFRGYLFNRFWEFFGNSWKANFVVTIGFLLIHLPISIFVFNFSLNQVFLSFLLLFTMSLGSGWLFSLTYNTIPPILWHFLWNWQVILGV